ncbi:hypothetical protein [Bacillus subtilis]|uniref:hypothetical protein n=1 Tax=Bacillus subtilis TaxID=1423 RepID=UPI002DBF8282|nr:hypothetical protein [Bacillus subtilis]MEC1005847.1 hypothetical protein [Bacillus subtilis]MEC1074930.1 hypothetical protein [Bacillus subtilis]
MSLNSEYQGINQPDTRFWRELGVSIDSVMELDSLNINSQLQTTLNKQKKDTIAELCTLYNLKVHKEKENNITSLLKMDVDKKREILVLQDFKNRRRNAINKFYRYKFENETEQYNSSTLTKLKHLYDNSFRTMIDIYTLYSWDIKSTGDRYTFEKKISKIEALKIPNVYKDTLVNTLFSGGDRKYKVFSYMDINSKIIVILYKQINDATRPDFDKALRNKEVVPLLFCVDVDEKIIEIKGASEKEKERLIKYFKENFNGCHPTLVKADIFNNYSPEDVIEAFTKGISPSKAEINDFIVNKITFRESPITNSPKVTLELENQDIWPSVIYAHINNCINLESLKDIESLTIKSKGKSRSIRSIILDNGNVLFTMNDSRLDEQAKQIIAKNFNLKFGIPLNQEIVNSKFEAGKADKVDYIMGIRKDDNLESDGLEILQELKKNSIIDPIVKRNFYCPVCNMEREITEEIDLNNGCPDCENPHLKIKNVNEYRLNSKAIKSFIRKSLKQLDEWVISKVESNLVLDENEHYRFFNLKHKEQDEILQVLITDQSIPLSIINRLKTMMTPTIIILVGQLEKFSHAYNSDCLHSITFGNIYVMEEHTFCSVYSKIISNLKQRFKSYVHNAASIAATSLSSIVENPSLIISKKYTNKKFEDDIYAILKDLFPNSIKWGKEASGKALPEGIFAITHFQRGATENEIKRVFSYDCKLNEDNKGYNLTKSEQRKATEYVKKLNDNDIITNFSDKKELTGHIFISNKFKEAQFTTMQEHFYENLGETSNAKPVFITLEVLLKIHKLYRDNYVHLSNSRNTFSKYLIHMFSKEVITSEIVDKAFKKILNKNVQEYDQLDTDAVTEFMDEGLI